MKRCLCEYEECETLASCWKGYGDEESRSCLGEGKGRAMVKLNGNGGLVCKENNQNQWNHRDYRAILGVSMITNIIYIYII